MSEIRPKRYKLKNEAKIAIRSARPSDARLMLEHRRTIIGEDLSNITMLDEFKETVEQTEHLIVQYTQNPGRLVLVAELDNRLLGTLWFTNSSRRRLSHRGVFHLGVRADYRRLGVGTGMLNTLIEWARENPVIEKVCASVLATNRAAILLCDRCGFLQEGRRVQEVRIAEGQYVDEILMYRLVRE
jgi:RimJ/RimL family protein N-acetyltransferase